MKSYNLFLILILICSIGSISSINAVYIGDNNLTVVNGYNNFVSIGLSVVGTNTIVNPVYLKYGENITFNYNDTTQQIAVTSNGNDFYRYTPYKIEDYTLLTKYYSKYTITYNGPAYLTPSNLTSVSHQPYS